HRVANEIGDAAAFRQVEVAGSSSVKHAFDWNATAFALLDILVNNAGIPLVGNVEETAEEDFERLHRVNVSGVFHGCKHAVKIMARQGGGNIIQIGSGAGLLGV